MLEFCPPVSITEHGNDSPDVCHCIVKPTQQDLAHIRTTSSMYTVSRRVLLYTIYSIKVGVLTGDKISIQRSTWCDSVVATDLKQPSYNLKLCTNVLLVDYYNCAKGGPLDIRLSPTVSDQRSTEVAAIMTNPPAG